VPALPWWENTVIPAKARHSAVIGDDVVAGPHAHVNGTRIGDGLPALTGNR
jgi:gamma-carbonic anhydrase